jgi:tetratricopeptide (TPR) repeat protein
MLVVLLTYIPVVQATQDVVSRVDEDRMVANYEAAMARGEQTAALKSVLDYSEDVYGVNAPQTIRVMHRYGSSLYRDGDYEGAYETLKKALERSTAAYGESGGEAFELNMNLAYAYGEWRGGLASRIKYFDRALEILRERGEHETITYVTTLVNIVVNLMDSGRLKGSYSSHLSDSLYSAEAAENTFPIENEYSNNYGRAEKYLLEAVEIGAKLENLDEYISSKISILQAKLNVMETADLAAVPMGVTGYISGGTEGEYYDREQERLVTAIDDLSQDAVTNKIFLDAANKVLMEIAWLDKDEARLMAMCSNGTVNSADEYPPDRLYDVMEGGMVFAPDIGIRVSTNIFRPLRSRGQQPKDKDGNPIKRPYFIPVCIDGHLMAALIHAPRVTVEEVR